MWALNVRGMLCEIHRQTKGEWRLLMTLAGDSSSQGATLTNHFFSSFSLLFLNLNRWAANGRWCVVFCARG